jgi:hypothetical protein
VSKLIWTAAVALSLMTVSAEVPSFAKSSGKGAYCAWFSGVREVGAIHTWYQPYRASRCFSSLASCKSWLYNVQTAFPLFMDFKPCGKR